MNERQEIILWQPTPGRVAEIVDWADRRSGPIGRGRASLDLVIRPAPDSRLHLIEAINRQFKTDTPRLTLLIAASEVDSIDYPLLRRLQDHNWKIAICADTDRTLRELRGEGEKSGNLARAIEACQHFRIEADLFLSLPVERNSDADAEHLFLFLANAHVRMISFSYQLLLRNMKVTASDPSEGFFEGLFFETLLRIWGDNRNAFYFHDVYQIARRLLRLGGQDFSGDGDSGQAGILYVDEHAVYEGVTGPIVDRALAFDAATMRPSGTDSNAVCMRQCEYYRACGGAYPSERFLYNGTLLSADNPYCRSVVMPTLLMMMEGAAHG